MQVRLNSRRLAILHSEQFDTVQCKEVYAPLDAIPLKASSSDLANNQRGSHPHVSKSHGDRGTRGPGGASFQRSANGPASPSATRSRMRSLAPPFPCLADQ
jgi:hypothetical protein